MFALCGFGRIVLLSPNTKHSSGERFEFLKSFVISFCQLLDTYMFLSTALTHEGTEPGRRCIKISYRARKAFRIHEHITPHSARKIYAVAEYKKDCDIRRVKKLLNHSDEAITMLYALADELTARAHRPHTKKPPV